MLQGINYTVIYNYVTQLSNYIFKSQAINEYDTKYIYCHLLSLVPLLDTYILGGKVVK
jgi:hypothetical protein